MSEAGKYLPYSEGVEIIQPDEAETFQAIADSMRRIGEMMFERYRHAVRSVHAKNQGVLVGEMEVYPNLPQRLAQGLFAQPARYPALLRFSTNPGDVLPDSISTPRGLSVKVLGPEGQEMVAGHAGQRTQDFVMANSPTFGQKDAKAFLKNNLVIEHHADDPQAFKEVVAFGARAADRVLSGLGKPSGQLRKLGGHPLTHPLGETYYLQLPVRYGEYVAKLAFAPASAELRALKDQPLAVYGHPNAIRDAVQAFFKEHGGEWDVQVQLCTDLESMPVEDGSVEWPQSESPYLTVGRLSVRPQDADAPEQRAYADEALSFSPWHALAAHRPLGNLMRARQASYQASVQYRQQQNGVTGVEPKEVAQLSGAVPLSAAQVGSK